GPPVPEAVTFAQHTCVDVATVTIPQVDDVVYRLHFGQNDGIWVAVPAGTHPIVKGLGIFPHDEAGEPIYDTLTVAAHQVSTWPNDPLETWTFTFTEPADCEAPEVPEPTVEVEWDEWVQADWVCGDTETIETRNGVKTTTTYKVVGEPGNWAVEVDEVTTKEVVDSRTV